jgi:hypothetical protein
MTTCSKTATSTPRGLASAPADRDLDGRWIRDDSSPRVSLRVKLAPAACPDDELAHKLMLVTKRFRSPT